MKTTSRENRRKVTVEQRVKDIMQPHVVTVGADDPVMSVCRLFFDEQISGAPVISETGSVVGVVSLTDIVRAAGQDLPHLVSDSSYYRQIRASQPSWMEDPQEMSARLSTLTVSDIMTEHVVSVGPGAPISHLAKLIREHHVHRVLVIDPMSEADELAGIVSVFDLVSLLE
jgi:CBS domain-containing protein